MTASELSEILGGWKGYEIESLERRDVNGGAQIWAYLRASAGLRWYAADAASNG